MSTKLENATRTDAFKLDPEQLHLVTDPKDSLYDPRINLPLDEGLVRNIAYQGVIEPVVVVKRADKFVVVDGRQRVRCAIEANKRLREQGKEAVRIICVPRRGADSDLFGVSVSANENRQDDTPLGRAEKCARLLAMGKTEEEAALIFGVTTQSINLWMKLLECSAPVRKAVEEGKLAVSAALQLYKLPADQQATTLQSLIQNNNGKRPTAKKVARAIGANGSGAKSRKEIREMLEEVDEKLSLEGKDQKLMGWQEALIWVLGK